MVIWPLDYFEQTVYFYFDRMYWGGGVG
jgi:hypothetical protein